MVKSTARITGTTAGSTPTRPTARGMATPTATATATAAAATAIPSAAAATTATTDVPATPGESFVRPTYWVWVKQPICTCSADFHPFPYLLLSSTTEHEPDAHFQLTRNIREQDEWNVSKSQTFTRIPSNEPSENEPAERSHPSRSGALSPRGLDCKCGRWRRYFWKLRPIEVRLKLNIMSHLS